MSEGYLLKEARVKVLESLNTLYGGSGGVIYVRRPDNKRFLEAIEELIDAKIREASNQSGQPADPT